MAVFFIFLFVDILTVVIFMAVYGGKKNYSEGMLLGVHIPPYAVEEPEVKTFIEAYQKKSKRFYIVNLLLSIAISFLSFGYLSIFILVWTLWLVELIAGAMIVLYGAHKKMYDIKMVRGWYGASGSKIVVVDTNVSASGGKLPFSLWWHMPILIGGAALFFFPGTLELMRKLPEMWLFTGIFIGMFIAMILLHVWTGRSRNKVYSEDSDINLRMNQTEKRIYSGIWLLSNYINLLSMITVIYFSAGQQWLDGIGICSYIFMQTLAGAVILAGILYLGRKRKEILDSDMKPLYVDDDVYWKNGWYDNPNDRRLWVQDWTCAANFTTNMARPAGKVFTVVSLVIVGVLLIGMCLVFLKLDFTPIYLKAGQDVIAISAPMYQIEFKRTDIKDIELLEALPDESFSKSNGMADSRQLLGKFRGKESGECRMYIYKDYSPILKIELPEYTVFINSKEAEKTKRWFRNCKNYSR